MASATMASSRGSGSAGSGSLPADSAATSGAGASGSGGCGSGWDSSGAGATTWLRKTGASAGGSSADGADSATVSSAGGAGAIRRLMSSWNQSSTPTSSARRPPPAIQSQRTPLRGAGSGSGSSPGRVSRASRIRPGRPSLARCRAIAMRSPSAPSGNTVWASMKARLSSSEKGGRSTNWRSQSPRAWASSPVPTRSRRAPAWTRSSRSAISASCSRSASSTITSSGCAGSRSMAPLSQLPSPCGRSSAWMIWSRSGIRAPAMVQTTV